MNKKFEKSNYFKKSWWWYFPMFFVLWIALIFIIFYFTVYMQWSNVKNSASPTAVRVFLIITGITISCSWIFGSYGLIKDVILGNLFRRYLVIKQLQMVQNVIVPKKLKVILLVPTKNDFMKNTLLQTINGQIYKFSKIFILDDSTDESFIKLIDQFVESHKNKLNIEVIRRNSNNLGKVGNLNHFFRVYKENYDFAAMIDADEVLLPNFVSDNLKIFYSPGNEDIGLVQSTRATYRRETFFHNGSRYWDNSLKINEILDNKTCVTVWYGHGSLISKACISANGNKITNIMADVGVPFDLLKVGYRTFTSHLSPTGSCDALNFNAARKRIIRNKLLFFQYCTSKIGEIFSSNIDKWKKICFLYPVFCSFISIATFFALLNNVILQGLGYHSNSVIFFTIIALILSMGGYINWVLLPICRMSLKDYARHLLIGSLAASCIFWQSIEAYFRYFILNRRKIYFNVTPKYDQNWNFFQSIWVNRRELICMIVMLSISIVLYFFVVKDHSMAGGVISFLHIPNFFMPLIPTFFTQILTIPLTLVSNIKSKEDFFKQKNIKVDVLFPYTKLKKKYGLST